MSGHKLFKRRCNRVRRKIKKYSSKPRLSVHRTNKHIYAQIIDDAGHVTLAYASTQDASFEGVTKTWDVEAAKRVGELIAKKAIDAKVKQVVFDRGGFVYHGRIKAVADAARASGLQF